MFTSGTRGEALAPNSNESNSTLMSETSGSAAPPKPYELGEGVNYPTPRVPFYANECNKGRDTDP